MKKRESVSNANRPQFPAYAKLKQKLPVLAIMNRRGAPCSMLDIRKKLEEEITALEYELRNELPRDNLRGPRPRRSERERGVSRRQRTPGLRQCPSRPTKKNALGELSMIDMTTIPHDKVGLGLRVVVLDVKKDEQFTYYLVDQRRGRRAHRQDIHRFADRKIAARQTKWATPLICRRPAAQRNWKP